MEPVAPPASGDGVMAQQLEPAQRQQRHEVADVQAVGGGVKAAVERDGAWADAFRQLLRVGAIGQQAAPLEFVQNVHRWYKSHCSRPHRRQKHQQLRHERPKVLDLIGASAHDDDGNPQAGKVLLPNEVLVNGKEGIKLRVGRKEESAVAQAQPIHLADGEDLVPHEQPGQPLGQTFVEENFHAAASVKRARASSSPSMACCRVTDGKSSRNSSRE